MLLLQFNKYYISLKYGLFHLFFLMNKIKLLLIEDDFSFSFIVKGSLELTGGYDVYVAATGEEGLKGI